METDAIEVFFPLGTTEAIAVYFKNIFWGAAKSEA